MPDSRWGERLPLMGKRSHRSRASASGRMLTQSLSFYLSLSLSLPGSMEIFPQVLEPRAPVPAGGRCRTVTCDTAEVEEEEDKKRRREEAQVAAATGSPLNVGKWEKGEEEERRRKGMARKTGEDV